MQCVRIGKDATCVLLRTYVIEGVGVITAGDVSPWKMASSCAHLTQLTIRHVGINDSRKTQTYSFRRGNNGITFIPNFMKTLVVTVGNYEEPEPNAMKTRSTVLVLY